MFRVPFILPSFTWEKTSKNCSNGQKAKFTDRSSMLFTNSSDMGQSIIATRCRLDHIQGDRLEFSLSLSWEVEFGSGSLLSSGVLKFGNFQLIWNTLPFSTFLSPYTTFVPCLPLKDCMSILQAQKFNCEARKKKCKV